MTQWHLNRSSESALCPLRVENLSKSLGGFRIEANFTLKVGEIAALLGKSGSGKTTLLRIIAGLESLSAPQDQGQIYLGNQEITNFAPQKREIGFVFQDQALFSGFNVIENVTFGLRMRGVPRKVRDELARSWLDKVGLKSRILSPVDQLSGGEKQRVAWVRALIWKPKLLLLDEPFSALDREMKMILRNELRELHRLWPVPLLWVTHDEGDVESLATTVLSLSLNSDSSVRTVTSRVDQS